MLPPGATRNLGAWVEAYDDAQADLELGDLELGDLVAWFDLFVGEQETTDFEVR